VERGRRVEGTGIKGEGNPILKLLHIVCTMSTSFKWLAMLTIDQCPAFHKPHVEQRRSTGGIDTISQLPRGCEQMTARVCMPHGLASQICTHTHTHTHTHTLDIRSAPLSFHSGSRRSEKLPISKLSFCCVYWSHNDYHFDRYMWSRELVFYAEWVEFNAPLDTI